MNKYQLVIERIKDSKYHLLAKDIDLLQELVNKVIKTENLVARDCLTTREQKQRYRELKYLWRNNGKKNSE